ncbi:hypothetical protein DE170_000657 [Clostridium acetobutylicum]|nr:hypothetical protein [Clostridium acetobutylicum]NYC92616.1 hypothetical protein [Clostridium acetobutylicum]
MILSALFSFYRKGTIRQNRKKTIIVEKDTIMLKNTKWV